MTEDIKLTSIIFGLVVIYFTIPSILWGTAGFGTAMLAAWVWGAIFFFVKASRGDLK